jgi:SAM-dependent methyltransferase
MSAHDTRPVSPVTGRPNVTVVDRIPVEIIVALYREEQQLDVRRFFTGLDEVLICRCDDSGFRFYHPLETAGDSLFYQQLQQKKQYYRTNRLEHRRALELIPDQCDLLEIGCGDGFFLEFARKKIKSGKGLEFNPSAVSAARAKGLDVDQETVEAHAAANPGRYDVVCSFQVLEHVSDVKSFLEASLLALRPGGLMLIAVPNNNPYMYRFDKFDPMNMPPHHVGLWDRTAFDNLPRFFPMQLAGLEVEPLVGYSAYLGAWMKHRVGFRWGRRLNSLLTSKPVSPFVHLLSRPFLQGREGRNIIALYRK